MADLGGCWVPALVHSLLFRGVAAHPWTRARTRITAAAVSHWNATIEAWPSTARFFSGRLVGRAGQPDCLGEAFRKTSRWQALDGSKASVSRCLYLSRGLKGVHKDPGRIFNILLYTICYTILEYTILYYNIIYYTLLQYTMLYYTIL